MADGELWRYLTGKLFVFKYVRLDLLILTSIFNVIKESPIIL